MGRPELDKKILGTMGSWGGNYNNTDGNGHNPQDDKIDPKVDSKDITLNVPSKMDASHAKPDSMNPGFDKSFWAKAEPQEDTTGHGKLTRHTDDTHDRM